MFRFFKGEPGEFVLHHARGKVRHEGSGAAFWYFTPTASLTLIPTTTLDASFIFNEVTRDFQAITVQGTLTYRIKEPRRLAEVLDFSIDAKRARRSKDPDKLVQRIVNVVQKRTQLEVRRLALQEALARGGALAADVRSTLDEDLELTECGVEVLSLHFLAVKPAPETAKALEAELREALQRKADEAIYARRAAAVEQERKIKENELATEILLEEQKKALLELQAANAEREATFKAKVTEIELAPYAHTDPRTLLALAFKSMGENAKKIGNLTLTPDLLSMFIQQGK